MHKILIIDDEKDICFLISEILKDEAYITASALNSDDAIKKFNENKPDLIILDVWLSNSKLDGIELLQEFKKLDNKIPIIIISGHGTVDLAVKSIKNGAYDFLEKPFNSDKLVILSKRAIESSQLITENKDLKKIIVPKVPLVGNSAYIKNISKKVKDQTTLNSRLLISGEFGTGKRHLANLIHYQSKFKDKLPVSIDCRKLTNEALDKLFLDNKEYLNENLFVRSNNNTLILINVDILPKIYQKKFLFFLKNENFFKNLNIKLNIKIICITESNIKKDIEKENFLKRLLKESRPIILKQYRLLKEERIYCLF